MNEFELCQTEPINSTQADLFCVANKIINRSKFILASLIFLTLILFPPINHFVLAPTATAASQQQAPKVVRSEAENFYLEAVNNLRAERNLKPLAIDSRLSLSANKKAIDMSEDNYFGHWAPDNKSFSDFIWTDSPKAMGVAENLAHCFDSRQKAYDALVNSPTHYAIMVGQYENFGVSESFNKNTGCTDTVMHFSRYSP